MRRVLIAIGLSAALVGALAGSASAATWTPASWDFGKVPVGGKSYQDFTLTKGAERTFEVDLVLDEPAEQLDAQYAIFTGLPSGAGIECPTKLTATFTTCNIRIYFTPAYPGRFTGSLLSDAPQYGTDPAAPIAPFSGVGVQKCKKGKHSARSAKKKCKKKSKKKS